MSDPNSTATSSSDAPSPPPPPKTWGRTIREWVVSLAIVAAILFPARSSIIDWNDVPTGSMRPTILEGERIFVNLLAFGLRVPFTNKWVARWDTPKRGEVVTLRSPADGIRLVKRVVGVPGDTFEIRNYTVYINGQPASHTPLNTTDMTFTPNRGPVQTQLFSEALPADPRLSNGAPGVTHTIAIERGNPDPRLHSRAPEVIPPGKYFMMGDNRSLSLDSRSYGFADESLILGRSPFVVLSFDKRNYYKPRFGRWFTRLR